MCRLTELQKKVTETYDLPSLCEAAGKEIHGCVEMCHSYDREHLIVKCLKSPVWEGTFVDYATRFAKRQQQFMRTVSLVTSMTMVETSVIVKEMNAK